MRYQRDICAECGASLHSTTSDYCDSPECRKFAAELSRARWDGHLLRNNVQPSVPTKPPCKRCGNSGREWHVNLGPTSGRWVPCPECQP